MKKLLTLSFMMSVCFSAFASYNTKMMDENFIEINYKNITISDPCLDAAINAQSQAFALEAQGESWCRDTQTTGQGYYDCAHAFTVIRQQMVSFIQSTFEPCPSGNGLGNA